MQFHQLDQPRGSERPHNPVGKGPEILVLDFDPDAKHITEVRVQKLPHVLDQSVENGQGVAICLSGLLKDDGHDERQQGEALLTGALG